MFRLARVIERFPDKGGVRVLFRDASATGKQANHFVRVLQRRAHPSLGSSVELPAEGELGLLAELSGLGYVWLGSVHMQDQNQIDGTDGLFFWRHDSGVQIQVRPDGSFQLDHPSGTKLAFGPSDADLPALKATSKVAPGTAPDPWVRLTHSSGLSFKVSPSGDLTITGLGSVSIGDSNLKRLVMEPLLDWLASHTHTSASAGSPTSTPIQALDHDSMLSTAKIKAEQGA